MDSSYIILDTIGIPLYSFKNIVQMGIEIARKKVEYRADTIVSEVLGPEGLFFDTLKVEGAVYDLEELPILPLFLRPENTLEVNVYTGTKGMVDRAILTRKGLKVKAKVDKRKYEVEYLDNGVPLYIKDKRTGIKMELLR